MKKYILDFNFVETAQKAQEYILLKLDFPDYYGSNLDALYDCLTEITKDVCIGLFVPSHKEHPLYAYGRKLVRVFSDAERDNEHLCVIHGELLDNFTEEES